MIRHHHFPYNHTLIWMRRKNPNGKMYDHEQLLFQHNVIKLVELGFNKNHERDL